MNTVKEVLAKYRKTGSPVPINARVQDSGGFVSWCATVGNETNVGEAPTYNEALAALDSWLAVEVERQMPKPEPQFCNVPGSVLLNKIELITDGMVRVVSPAEVAASLEDKARLDVLEAMLLNSGYSYVSLSDAGVVRVNAHLDAAPKHFPNLRAAIDDRRKAQS